MSGSSGLRAGVMVRIVNPASPYLGVTGHVVGASEQLEERWMIRLTTLSQTVFVATSDVQVIAARPTREQGHDANDPTDVRRRTP